MAHHPARTDLEEGGEHFEAFEAALIDETRTRDSICEEFKASGALVSRRRKAAREARDAKLAAEGKPPLPRAGESEKNDPKEGFSANKYSTTPWAKPDYENFLREKGMDPEEYTFTWGWTSDPHSGGFWNKLNNVRPISPEKESGPAWPLIQPAAPVVVHGIQPAVAPARNGMMLSLKCADPQIGFRQLPDGTFEAFHDWTAMMLFVEVCRQEQPESIIILGDVLDLPSVSRHAQEAGFQPTTQKALDTTHEWLAMLRAACPDALIVMIEGNHDKRLQMFIETNALAAYGLRRANMPEEWPTLSVPYLLRLDELGVIYEDAYPNSKHWDDDRTQNIHGTRANSKGSTTAQYAAELPHINTWAGHTHRTEITYKTVMGPRGEAIESYSANPGCLAKTTGAVPSVHGALKLDGSSSAVVEDWQQGFGSLLFDGKGESWPQVHRIRDGRTVYQGRLISVTP